MAQVQEEDWVMIWVMMIQLIPIAWHFYENRDLVESKNCKVIRYATQIDQNNAALSGIYTHPKYENSTDFLMRNLGWHPFFVE
jgi:hypothetical protein